MNNNKISRKSINFDLGTYELEHIYPLFTGKKDISHVYDELEKIFLKYGFIHDQYSGYVSLKPMRYYKVNDIFDIISHNEAKWLKYCFLNFRITEIDNKRFNSLNEALNNVAIADKNKDAKEFSIKNFDKILEDCKEYRKNKSNHIVNALPSVSSIKEKLKMNIKEEQKEITITKKNGYER